MQSIFWGKVPERKIVPDAKKPAGSRALLGSRLASAGGVGVCCQYEFRTYPKAPFHSKTAHSGANPPSGRQP